MRGSAECASGMRGVQNLALGWVHCWSSNNTLMYKKVDSMYKSLWTWINEYYVYNYILLNWNTPPASHTIQVYIDDNSLKYLVICVLIPCIVLQFMRVVKMHLLYINNISVITGLCSSSFYVEGITNVCWVSIPASLDKHTLKTCWVIFVQQKSIHLFFILMNSREPSTDRK